MRIPFAGTPHICDPLQADAVPSEEYSLPKRAARSQPDRQLPTRRTPHQSSLDGAKRTTTLEVHPLCRSWCTMQPRHLEISNAYWRFILFSVAVALILAVALTAFFIRQGPKSANLAITTNRTIIAHHTAIPTLTPTLTPTITPTLTPIPTPTQPAPIPTNPPQTNNPPISITSTITNLGGLDFQAYCLSIGDTSASLDQNNAYGWTCVTPAGNHTLVDTDAVCQWQYSNEPNVLARMVNYSDSNNWRCYSHVTNLGSINFTQYCQSLGEEASLNGSTVYNWYCLVSGHPVIIDTNAACEWQYNESDAIASVGNYFDPNGWVCYGKA